jgi:hypothetical protein
MSQAGGMQYHRRGCPNIEKRLKSVVSLEATCPETVVGLSQGSGRTRVSSTLLERINFLALFGNGGPSLQRPGFVDAV